MSRSTSAIDEAKGGGENQPSCGRHVLNELLKCNPWTRPHTALIAEDQLAVFQNGIRLDNDTTAATAAGSTVRGSKSIEKSIQLHHSILNDLSKHVQRQYEKGKGQELVHQRFEDAVQQMRHYSSTSTGTGVDDGDGDDGGDDGSDDGSDGEGRVDGRASAELAAFYRYLIGCWNGMSPASLQLLDGCVIPGDPEHAAYVSNRSMTNEIPGVDQSASSLPSSSSAAAAASSKSSYPSTGDGIYTPQGDFPGPHCSVQGGMITIIKGLLSQLPSRGLVKTKHSVTSIQDRFSHLRLTTSEGVTVRAKYCVSTMPLGCMQRICSDASRAFFDPPLPVEKQHAMLSLCSGAYKKVLLTFKTIWWPRHQLFVGLINSKGCKRKMVGKVGVTAAPTTDNAKPASATSTSWQPDGNPIGEHLLLYNLWARHGVPCIEAVLFGDAGEWATHKPDDMICDAVMSFLQNTMEVDGVSVTEQLVDCHVTRWEEDPYSLGSYSSFRLGTQDQDVDVLQRDEYDGRLLFAGEATDGEHMGSVHGAIFSGRQAAHRLLNHLQCS